MAKITKNDLKTIYDNSVVLDRFKYTIPIDPFKIAEDLDIKIDNSMTTEMIKRSGSISKDGDTITIWVNRFDADVRRRFTAAHELGHYVNGDLNMEDDPYTLYRTEGVSNPKEDKANEFAAKLLMPKNRIYAEGRNVIAESEDDPISSKVFIDKMARIFNVSKATMLYRLKDLKIV